MMLKYKTGSIYKLYGLYSLFCVVFLTFAYSSSLGEVSNTHFSNSISSHILLAVWVLPELIVLYLVAALLAYAGCTVSRRFYFVFICFTFLVVTVYCIQSVSLYSANGFVPPTALENIVHANLVKGSRKFVIGGVLLIAWFFAVYSAYFFTRLHLVWGRFIVLLCASLFVLILQNSTFLFPQFRITELMLGRATPTVSLIKNGYDVFFNNTTKHAVIRDESLKALDLYFNVSSKYPFSQRTVPLAELPLGTALDKLGNYPNLIVLFIEGLSARTLEPYSQSFPGMTESFKAISQQSLVFYNYYNHTAATQRGLQGQLTSSYPMKTMGEYRLLGKPMYMPSLAHMLKEHGYETYFLSPHGPSDRLAVLIEELGFNKVFIADTINSELLDDEASLLVSGRIRDSDIFNGLTRFLQTKESEQAGSPFFVGLYNIETHVSFDTSDNDLKYGNGKNRVLNTIHNVDYHLGQFFRFFQKSPLAENTILIVTTDHCHYPEPLMVELGGEDFQPYFVDKIPLMVYAPFLELPAKYDAKGRNSLDFAPTVLNLIGIGDQGNSFLGKSLFLPRSEENLSFSLMGKDFYIIRDGVIYPYDIVPAELFDLAFDFFNYISMFYAYEKNDRIYPKSPSLQSFGDS